MRWLIVTLLLALSTLALADGSGTLTGTGKLRVQSCGKDRGAVTWTVQLTGSNWTTTVNGNNGPSGTASPVGSSGKIWNFAFDANSKTGFDLLLAAAATNLCETTVTLTQPSTVTHFNLKLNKRSTRAKLTLFARGTGSSIEGTGVGKLNLILRGPWQQVAP
jgi:hypothetical protein